jgi:hypothetical protein
MNDQSNQQPRGGVVWLSWSRLHCAASSKSRLQQSAGACCVPKCATTRVGSVGRQQSGKWGYHR